MHISTDALNNLTGLAVVDIHVRGSVSKNLVLGLSFYSMWKNG